jgi:hypothetical protein
MEEKKKKDAKEIPEAAGPKPITHGPIEVNVVDVVKQAMIGIKYEEIGSWLATHRTPLFYAHKEGLTVVDQKFIDERDWLKKALAKLVEEVNALRKKREGQQLASQNGSKEIELTKEKVGYIG